MDTIEVFVETPKGSKFKYKFDKKKERLVANKVLPVGLAFPYDFGFIPNTKGEDGDPLDAMIITEDSFLPGSIVECRILCSIKAEQTSVKGGDIVRNDRIMVVPEITMEKGI